MEQARLMRHMKTNDAILREKVSSFRIRSVHKGTQERRESARLTM